MPFTSKNALTMTSFKPGHTRSKSSILKQSKTMRESYRLGLRVHPVKPKGIKDKYDCRDCDICKKSFVPVSGRQKWCKECVPDKKSRMIYQRYFLTSNQYQSLLVTNSGMCWICLKKKAQVVDHCHKTGRIRGLLCHRCNTALPFIEDQKILKRAMEYVSIPK